jgi:hypothetical protein
MEHKIVDGLVEEGFDDDTFNKWMEGLGTSWEELLTKQD